LRSLSDLAKVKLSRLLLATTTALAFIPSPKWYANAAVLPDLVSKMFVYGKILTLDGETATILTNENLQIVVPSKRLYAPDKPLRAANKRAGSSIKVNLTFDELQKIMAQAKQGVPQKNK
jgi:hypothetical protein